MHLFYSELLRFVKNLFNAAHFFDVQLRYSTPVLRLIKYWKVLDLHFSQLVAAFFDFFITQIFGTPLFIKLGAFFNELNVNQTFCSLSILQNIDHSVDHWLSLILITCCIADGKNHVCILLDVSAVLQIRE